MKRIVPFCLVGRVVCAEAAVPEARLLLVDAVKQMSIQDAASILTEVAGKASQLGLIDARDANLDGYVTRKALDGLFLMMAREEQAIRKDPLGQASSLLRKVLGAGNTAP